MDEGKVNIITSCVYRDILSSTTYNAGLWDVSQPTTRHVCACALRNRKWSSSLSVTHYPEAEMVEISGGHMTFGTVYGSCDERLSQVRTENEETEVLINTEKTVISRRAVVSLVILTTINLFNYADRYTIAGQLIVSIQGATETTQSKSKPSIDFCY